MAKNSRPEFVNNMMARMQGGMRAAGGDPLGAMAGFMGIPFFHRSWSGHGSAAGPGQMYYPDNNYGYGRRGNLNANSGGDGNDPGTGGNDPGTGGNDPAIDPATLGSLGKVSGFPQWYIDWYNSQGKYGGVPPVPGLL